MSDLTVERCGPTHHACACQLARVDRLEADVDLLREIVDAVAQGEHGPQLEAWARQALEQTAPKAA